MKKHKWAMILCISLAAAVVLFSVMLKKGRTGQRKWKLTYIVKINDRDNDFWTSLLEGAQMAADEYGVQLSILAPEREDDYEMQNQLILGAIKENPDAIVLSPCSYTEVTETAKKIREAGIYLIMVDSFLDEPIEDSSITTDNFQAGVKMGTYLADKLDEKSVIGIVSHVKESSTAMEREKGLRNGLGKFEQQIADVVFCNSDYEKAYEETKRMLAEHPDMNVIFGLNEYSAVGAARAVRDLGLSGKIQMVGFDNSIEEIQMLEAGIFSGIVIQKPFSMGYLGVEKAVSLLKGEAVSKRIDAGSELITKENIYTEENQKLLFPFWDK